MTDPTDLQSSPFDEHAKIVDQILERTFAGLNVPPEVMAEAKARAHAALASARAEHGLTGTVDEKIVEENRGKMTPETRQRFDDAADRAQED